MQKNECINLLKTQYFQDIRQKNNPSRLTSNAWGENKSICMQQIGDFSDLKMLLNSF